jgi:membrane protein implicated in regulation of membrane protease activity
MDVLYWHWIILGILLILFELIIPSFTAMWFGLGAVVVGAILWFEPDMEGSYQVLVWAVLSGVLTFFWFRVFKPKKRHHDALKEEVEGESGLVATQASGTRPGIVRFSTPLLGEDEWPYRSELVLEIGQQVKVLDVKDNILIVTKRA